VKTIEASIPGKPRSAPEMRGRMRSDPEPRVDADDATLRARQMQAQVLQLKRALAASHRDALAAHREVAVLKRATARSSESPAPFERDDASDVQDDPNWNVNALCLSKGLDSQAMFHLGRLLIKRTRFQKGQTLHYIGTVSKALVVIQAGSCKTLLIAKDGQEQICGYYIAGDVIGIEAIGRNLHDCQAVALEDLQVRFLSFDQLDAFANISSVFRRNLNNLISQEIARGHALMLMLGSMHAEQRVAAFLLDIAQRYKAKGYSPSEIMLRMTREEIGCLLGLKLETVSRTFSHFQRGGIVQVEGRFLKLLDSTALNRILDRGVPSPRGERSEP
jgi:CRP/FNR family transcriptional regulator